MSSWSKILVLFLAMTLLGGTAQAQFRTDPFSQTGSSKEKKDTTAKDEPLFSFKDYFAALRHEKDDLRSTTLFTGSMLFVGGIQIYNKQKWKLPISYGLIGGSLGAGIALSATGNKSAAKYCYLGAGVAYWATMLDGIISYKSTYPDPGKATFYSLLCPGLGQIYNQEYWKAPIYIGIMAFTTHLYIDYRKNFKRFKNIYLEATNPDIQYTGPVTAEQAQYYKNNYRRYRDYALLGTIAVYVLQIIDANVFAYMHNFEVNDDISFNMTPTVILPDDNQLAFSTSSSRVSSISPAVGLKLGINF